MADEADIADLEPFADMDKTASDEDICTKTRDAHEEADRRVRNQACASAAKAMVEKQSAANLVNKSIPANTESTERAERSFAELSKLSHSQLSNLKLANSIADEIAKELEDLQQKVDDQVKAIQERDAAIRKREAAIEKLQDMFEALRMSKKEVENKLVQARIDIAGHQEEIETLKREKNAGKAVELPEV